MKKRVTIKDIADHAGVSTGTVDRVLHNRGNVAKDVKERVLKSIDEFGYERNILASALAYNRLYRIAVLLPDPTKDPYWRQTDDGIQKASKAVKHYGMLLELFYFDYSSSQSFLDTAKKSMNQKPDGILFPPMFSKEARWLFEKCSALDIPAVVFNTNLDKASPLSYIGQDSYQSGFLGARLLNFGLNEGEAVCILNLDYGTKAAHHLLEKERGFRDYFSSIKFKRIEIIRRDFEGFDDPKKMTAFIEDLLRTYPKLSGIFCTNSRAYKLLPYLDEHHSKTIKIVGFDLIEANLKHLHEDRINFLINQNPSEQGFEGVMSLFKYLVLKEDIEPLQYLPLDIVVKENAEYYLSKHHTSEVIS